MVGHRRALVAAAALFVVSLAGAVALVATHPGLYWQQTDASTFRAAGSYVWHATGRLYVDPLGVAHLHYIYPPFGAIVFAPFSALPFAVWQVVLAAVAVLLLAYSADASLRLAGVEQRWPGVLALTAVGLWLEPVAATFTFGQSNLILMALVLCDLAAPASRRWRGVPLGIAAGIKLTPLIFVVFLFCTRRRRAALTGLATFAATVLLGALLLPRDAKTYWFGHVVSDRFETYQLTNQSLDAFAVRLGGDAAGNPALWLSLAIVLGGLAFAGAVLAARDGQQLLGACLCAAAGLLVSPISWTHHWVWVVPALALAATAAARGVGWAWGAAAALVAVFAWWPGGVAAVFGRSEPTGWLPTGLIYVVPAGNGAELGWGFADTLFGNAFVLAGAVGVLGCVAGLVSRRWRSRPTADPHTPAVPEQPSRSLPA